MLGETSSCLLPHLVCCLFILGINPHFLGSQELPPIQNYRPVDYQGENQNWGISQAANGWMYYANNGSLLEFNGVDWVRYPSPNGSVLRSVLAIGDRIYAGCYMEFGFWQRNTLGYLEYHSLSQNIDSELLPDEQFWKLRGVGDWVLFQSLERIYAYNISNQTLEVIPSKARRAQFFQIEDRLYFRREAEGILTIENSVPRLLIAESSLGDTVFVGMVKIGSELAWVGENGRYYTMVENRLQEHSFQVLQDLPFLKVYSSLQLKNGNLVLGTVSSGVFILSPQGALLYHINKTNGLNNNTVLSLFEDKDSNLWLGLDNGISVINMASAFREFNDRAGTLGVVYAATVHKGRLFLGTNQGLFKKDLAYGSSFSLVPGTEGQVWTIKVIGESLFCGHDRGTFLVVGDGASLISDQAGTWDIQAIPGSDELLMQGTYQGLGVLRENGSSWEFRNAIEGFDISSRFFQFTEKGNVVINHEYKGIFDLKLDDALLQVVDSAQTPPWGVGASLFKYQGALLYANDNGLFRYVPSRAQFQPDSALNTALTNANDRPLGVLISDTAESRLWGLGRKSLLYFEPQTLGGGYELNSIPVPEDFRNTLGVLGFECLTPLGKERYLIGRSNGYLTMDLTRLSNIEPEVTIHRLSQRYYKGAAEPLPLNEGLKIDYEQNNLEFAYHVIEYDKYTEVEYQYRLDGLQDQWSVWSTQSNVTFENLPYGDYLFEVRARIGNRSSEVSKSFSFRINRPWYLSYQALAVYFLSLLLISTLVHRQYKSYYRRQQEKVLEANRIKQKRKNLKAKKKIVEIRNTQLSKEIESKNRELAVSTMSLIRKNEFLNTLKNELLAIEDSDKIKGVIKTIDRNINNEADWEFFQEAFNNADKDFLKTIKQIHPELTPNDLKLCAYLRLNLSSKEIAPLLNISVRSVEVKRYRLRKKIDLPHEKGLAEYIIGL